MQLLTTDSIGKRGNGVPAAVGAGMHAMGMHMDSSELG